MNIVETVEKLKKETKALRKETIIIKTLIKQQNDLIKSLLEDAHGARICSKPFSKASKRYFPLTTQDELDQFENCVEPTNLNEIVYEVRLCIKPYGLAKSMPKIINEKLLFHYNLEGTYGKKRLFRYTNLMDVLFKAVHEDGTSHVDFIKEMRLALKYIKKRHFRRKYKSRFLNLVDGSDDNGEEESDDNENEGDGEEEFQLS